MNKINLYIRLLILFPILPLIIIIVINKLEDIQQGNLDIIQEMINNNKYLYYSGALIWIIILIYTFN